MVPAALAGPVPPLASDTGLRPGNESLPSPRLGLNAQQCRHMRSRSYGNTSLCLGRDGAWQDQETRREKR